VRIERLEVGAFGRLHDFDSGDPPLPSLVVALGPNEAGKSTLFEFLTTMLHGFLPASRELNPFVPWGTDEARGVLHLRLHDGRSASVTRRLRSQPAGQLVLAGEPVDVRNQPLPWVEHVPRRVFRQLFAITLGELASLDDETWARIQDRVVGSMGASDIRPARAVASEFEREAGELWRPNRRGNQKIREAREQLRELRGRRRAALDLDRRLRQQVDELERARRALEAKRDRRAQDQAELERARVLTPVRDQLRRIDALLAEAGPPELLKGIPPRPLEQLAELRAAQERLVRRLSALDEERRSPELDIALGPEAERVLAVRDEITRFSAVAARATADRQRAAELEEECQTLRRELDRLAHDLTGATWHQAWAEVLGRASIDAIRTAADRVDRLRAAREAAEVSVDGGGAALRLAPATDTRWGWILIGIGPVLLVGSVAGPESTSPWLLAVGLAALGVGAFMTWTARGAASAHAAQAAERERARGAAEDEWQRVLGHFQDLVRDLGLAEYHLVSPGPALVQRIERARERAEVLDQRVLALGQLQGRIRAAVQEGQELAARWMGPDTLSRAPSPPDLGPGEVATLLTERVRHAETAERTARAAERELARIDRNRDEARRELDTVLERLRVLETHAERFEGAAVSEQLANAEHHLEARERADKLSEELERSHPDLPRLRQRIDEAERAGARWLFDAGDMVVRAERVERTGDEIAALTGRIHALETEIDHAGSHETADWVDGEIATLETQLEAWTLDRDRKWVLARLLREADRRFREEHQPDLMRRASAYLAHLTGGRYDRILAEEDEDADLFRISGPGLAGPIPLRHPISTGTLEQAYLSLRLAIVDHLDAGPDRLPLFIDEVFVNWDEERRARGLELVGSIARTRQVFVFTCHPPLADELRAIGARLLTLPPR